MPLTEHQRAIARLLAENRAPESYLAGGAALHFSPRSRRYSDDLDFFHDSVERVAEAYAADSAKLEAQGYSLTIELRQPGYVRALVAMADQATKIEWAHDSAWRFMPPIYTEAAGYMLHPVDLATNKVLALAGRNEARDVLDALAIHEEMLSLGALCWAAVGKDPGFTPLSLLELMRRRGKFHAADFRRLHTVEPVDLVAFKGRWLAALDEADAFIRRMPAEDVGCLYYSSRQKKFIAPMTTEVGLQDDVVRHFGQPGGVLPQLYDGDVLAATWRGEARGG